MRADARACPATEIVGEALAAARSEEAESVGDAESRLASVRQEAAAARRALDRYFAAFEEGSLSPADTRERVVRLKGRIEALEAEERSLEQTSHQSDSDVTTADEIAEWAVELETILRTGSAQQRKALMRMLIKELRVMSRELILPTYKIPALVRAPEGLVELRGLEPLTPWLPAKCSTN